MKKQKKVKFNDIIEKIKRVKINIVADIFKLILFAFISLILRPFFKKKNIWLIEENPMEANDNGYALIEYIKNFRKDINVYYVISKNSKQIEKVKNISNIIYDRSVKHWIYYLNAKVIAVTQKYANPSPALFYVLHNLRLISGKRIFLQHGIIKDDIKCYYYNVCKFDLFICGAKREYDFIKEKFGYPEKNIAYTGIARFDKYNKVEERSNYILIAPTWRNWVKDNDKDIQYFNRWNRLINTYRLNEFLEENNITIKFVLHQEMNRFKDIIKSRFKRIQICKNDEISYSEILSKCLMLITDFSSVFFDIAYMKKPIIYFQFDEKEFRKKHLPEGYFSYNDDGFGDIFETEEEVINKIEQYKNKDFKMEEKYLNRVDTFFERRDEKNCERIVEKILNLDK